MDQHPAFLEKLELYKQELACHQLLISEETYADLKTKQNQSLKEFVQVKVFETLQTYLRDLEQYQFDNQQISAQLFQMRTQLEKDRSEKESLAKQLKEVRDDSRRQIDQLERRN